MGIFDELPKLVFFFASAEPMSNISKKIEDEVSKGETLTAKSIFALMEDSRFFHRAEEIDSARIALQKNELSNIRLYTHIGEHRVLEFLCECEDGDVYLVENSNVERQYICKVEREKTSHLFGPFRQDWKDSSLGIVEAGYLHDGCAYIVFEKKRASSSTLMKSKQMHFHKTEHAVRFIQHPAKRSWSTLLMGLFFTISLAAIGLSSPSPISESRESVTVLLSASMDCQLHVFPLDRFNNPIHSKGLVGNSPLKIRLAVGEYLVSAIDNQGNWIEVYRTVPNDSWKSQVYSTRRFVRKNGVVYLHPITIVGPADIPKLKKMNGFAIEETPSKGQILYDGVLDELEKKGLRLPTVSQLDSVFHEKEFTCNFSGGMTNLPPFGNTSMVTLVASNSRKTLVPRVLPYEKNQFRGVRSERPLQVIR